METRSFSRRMYRFSWPGLVAVFVMYLTFMTVSYWRPAQDRRPFKSQRDFTFYDVTRGSGSVGCVQSPDGGESVSRRNNSSSPKEAISLERRSNIVQLTENISQFPVIDRKECPSMLEDIQVAPAYSMPLTALASFPRSGNSWTRSLIQVATGYSTGSVHWESEQYRERVKNFFKAGTEDYMLRKGICIKTHEYAPGHIEIFNNGAILLIRNPYYSVVSEYFRYFAGTQNVSVQTLFDAMENKADHWTKGLLPQFQRWRNTTLTWILNCKRLLIVYFQDLEQHTVHELTRMVRFLGQPVEPKRILCAVENFKPMSAHRSKTAFDPYPPEMHSILDGYIAEVNRTIIAKGAKPLPTYPAYITPS